MSRSRAAARPSACPHSSLSQLTFVAPTLAWRRRRFDKTEQELELFLNWLCLRNMLCRDTRTGWYSYFKPGQTPTAARGASPRASEDDSASSNGNGAHSNNGNGNGVVAAAVAAPSASAMGAPRPARAASPTPAPSYAAPGGGRPGAGGRSGTAVLERPALSPAASVHREAEQRENAVRARPPSPAAVRIAADPPSVEEAPSPVAQRAAAAAWQQQQQAQEQQVGAEAQQQDEGSSDKAAVAVTTLALGAVMGMAVSEHVVLLAPQSIGLPLSRTEAENSPATKAIRAHFSQRAAADAACACAVASPGRQLCVVGDAPGAAGRRRGGGAPGGPPRAAVIVAASGDDVTLGRPTSWGGGLRTWRCGPRGGFGDGTAGARRRMDGPASPGVAPVPQSLSGRTFLAARVLVLLLDSVSA